MLFKDDTTRVNAAEPGRTRTVRSAGAGRLPRDRSSILRMDLAQINLLRFACIADAALLPPAVEDVRAADIHTTLAAAAAACTGRIAVFDADRLAAEGPAAAVANLSPYRPPKPVTAAGGYVVRRGAAGPEVLLIHRRGVWDLPKGKLDAGETVEACALREVREEVGIAALRLVRPLGTTIHGYPEKQKYRVKTTHWFLMMTPETAFTPQAEEDITAVAWTAWAEAGARLGFESLRRHHAAVTDAVLQAVQAGTKY